MAARSRRGRPFPPDTAPSHGFKKGVSGNPGGRSSAAAEMARRIRERTGDGLLLIDFALAVLCGTGEVVRSPDAPPKTKHEPVPTDAKSRMFALDWLSERGWGKAKQDLDILLGTVELSPQQAAMLEALKMSPHERRERMAEMRQRLFGAVTPETPREAAEVRDDDGGDPDPS